MTEKLQPPSCVIWTSHLSSISVLLQVFMEMMLEWLLTTVKSTLSQHETKLRNDEEENQMPKFKVL